MKFFWDTIHEMYIFQRWKWYLKLYFPLFFGKLKIIDKLKYNI